MRNWIIAAAAASALIAATAAGQPYRRGPRDRDRGPQPVVIEKQEVQERLDRVNSMLSEAIGKSQRDRALVRLLKAMRHELDGVRDHVAGAPSAPQAPQAQPMPGWNTNPGPPPPQPPPPAQTYPPQPPPSPPRALPVYPLDETGMRSLMVALDGESFGDGRLRVLGQAATTSWFLVPQVRTLLAKFDFPNDRLEAVRVVKHRILDRENLVQLYGAFEFSADKETLKEILAAP